MKSTCLTNPSRFKHMFTVIGTCSFSFIFAGLKFGENLLGTFRESLISRSRRKIVFAGNLISRNWRLSDFLFYKNCTLINNWNKTNMLPPIGSCIPLKVSLTVIKKVFLFLRVIIEYREYRYMSFLVDLNRTSNLFKWILKGKTKRFI